VIEPDGTEGSSSKDGGIAALGSSKSPPRARCSSNTKPRRMTICGTDEYMAPELHFDEEYLFGVDIFSFGIVLFEVQYIYILYCYF
jgi:serine/threonine protein kinase